MANVTISGVGSSVSVEIGEGETLDVALSQAGIEPDNDGLDVQVNGQEVDDPSEHTPENGDQVTATPKQVSLG